VGTQGGADRECRVARGCGWYPGGVGRASLRMLRHRSAGLVRLISGAADHAVYRFPGGCLYPAHPPWPPLRKGGKEGRLGLTSNIGYTPMNEFFNRESETDKRRQLRGSMPEAEVILWSRLKKREHGKTL